ncbi:MAG: hypothetical protein HA494_04490 [Thaumarchaeota archaeon]|nr:hypothetical protein [Nitrososphaerota archaeon]
MLRKIFSHWDLPLNPTLNLTLVYRRELSTLWRRLEKLEAIELEASDKSLIYSCAKILAEVSRLDRGAVYKRIITRAEEGLKAVKDLYDVIRARSIDDLRETVVFCSTLLNRRSLQYQEALLGDNDRQVAVIL